jgi:hypothetical protein
VDGLDEPGHQEGRRRHRWSPGRAADEDEDGGDDERHRPGHHEEGGADEDDGEHRLRAGSHRRQVSRYCAPARHPSWLGGPGKKAQGDEGEEPQGEGAPVGPVGLEVEVHHAPGAGRHHPGLAPAVDAHGLEAVAAEAGRPAGVGALGEGQERPVAGCDTQAAVVAVPVVDGDRTARRGSSHRRR